MDVRLSAGKVSEIAAKLIPASSDEIYDAKGKTLLPGLHDHHLHLIALAASLESVRCGPPDILSEDGLVDTLRRQNTINADRWVRGIAYHPCVAGDIDGIWLDRVIPDRPARIQHRGGRLWVLNSTALKLLDLPRADQPSGVEMLDGQPTGRLYECDAWLKEALNGQIPNLRKASELLASFGITGITDTSPANGLIEWEYFRESQHSGDLKQRVRMMGTHPISQCLESELMQRGEFKVHLLESQLPDLDQLQQNIQQAHKQGRSAAFHCVTRTELVYALSALQNAGVRTGDRIEHASVTPPELLQMMRDMGLRVVTQPHFIAERGDQYLSDVDKDDQPWLYRCAGFLNNNIPLAAGSDAPFGDPNPWQAMAAAVQRTTPSGVTINGAETLSPEQALSLFLSDSASPGVEIREIVEGSTADLCLLDGGWGDLRHNLKEVKVAKTWRAGELIYSA